MCGGRGGVHRVPAIQKQVLRLASQKEIPVIVATQMLASMVNFPYPTRTEVSAVANAVMLSEEATVGRYRSRSVRRVLA